MSQPATTRTRHHELRRAAVKLFREKGYHATSMQDLAEAMELNRGSLYHYIDSKEDLLWEVMTGVMAELNASLAPIEASSAPPAQCLRDAVAAHLRVAAERPDEMTVLQVELKSLSPARRKQIIAARDAYEARWRKILDAGAATGAFNGTEPKYAGMAILATCNWFTQWYRPGGPLTPDQLSEVFAGFFLNGLGQRGRR